MPIEDLPKSLLFILLNLKEDSAAKLPKIPAA